MKEVTIDCQGFVPRSDLHDAFARALSFPDWYGGNLDALHDQLTSLCEPTQITLLHWDAAEEAFGKYALGAKRTILDAAEENPNLTVTFCQEVPTMVQPLISVIIPVYGSDQYKQYLHQCMESVQNQTYSNLEIILTDDGSPDEIAAVCDRYAEADHRVKVIHKEHSGLAATRNAGLDAATGEYVAFVDSDDWIKPDTYEKMVAFIQENQEIDVVCCAAERYPKKDNELTFAYYPTGTIITGREMLRRILLDEIGSQVVIGLYKRGCWKNVRFPVGRLYEDIPTTYKAYIPARNVGFLTEPFYVYRTNESSISRTPVPIKTYHIFLGFREHFFAAREFVPEVADACCTQAAHYAVSCYFHYCAERPKELEPILEDVLTYLKDYKAVIRSNYGILPKTRKLALQIYYLSPFLFKTFARLLSVTGLQKKLGLEMK